MRTALIAIIIASAPLAGGGVGRAADLSPGRWPAATRAKLEQRDYYFVPPYPASVNARSVLVTGTGSPPAIHAGLQALKQGGTAADAAATVALTQVATHLGSVVSYAGVLKLIYFEAKTGRVHSLDASWGTYAGETDPASIPPTDISDISGIPAPKGAGTGALGRQTLVPGFMAGIEALHDRFGRLAFADLFRPAIWYAENGVTISPVLGSYFHERQPQLWRTAAGRRFASMPDGALPKVGDLYRQPELARTLRGLASQGARYMYAGEWARAFVEAVDAEGGKATLADLAGYKVQWNEPLKVSFAGAEVYAPGGSADSSCAVLAALNLLSAQSIERMGPYWKDATSFTAQLDAVRFAEYAAPVPQVGEWERSQGFSPNCRSRLSPEYAAVVAPQIRKLLTRPSTAEPRGSHTESVIVVDRWGNIAVLVHSINCTTWGDTGIVVGGVPIGDAGAINKDDLAKVPPGEHVPSVITPVLALRGSKPVLAVGAVGAGVIPETVRVAAGVLAQGRDLRTLMEAPPLLANVDPALGPLWDWRETLPAGAYDPKLRQAIEALGVHVMEDGPQRVQALRGSAVSVVIDQPSGAPSAVEVPRVFGFAEGDQPALAEIPREVNLPAKVLDAYVGDYDTGPKFSIHVYRIGHRLFAKPTDRAAVELFASSETTFFEKVENVQVAYERKGPGPAGRATIHLANGQNVVAIRRSLPSPR